MQTQATLSLPLLVDSQHGRLYALAQIGPDGPRHIAVFAARDGRSLATYDNGGPFALDAAADRLFVDRGAAGLTVLQASTGEILRTFDVHGPTAQYGDNPAPHFDVATNQVLAFRGQTLYAIDSETGEVARTVDFDLRPQDNCREPHDARLPVMRSFYDPIHRLLYLDFVTYSCIPWIGLTNVSYDMARGVEIARQGSSSYSGLAAGGRFYAMSWYRFGIGTIWTERDGLPGQGSTGWSSGSAFQLDAGRGKLYQSAEGSLRIFDADNMTLRAVAPQPVAGELAAYDETTDQLYFVHGGAVRTWPASDLQSTTATPMLAATPPGEPVRLLVPSPGWSQDNTLFAVWAPAWPETTCYVFNQSGGVLLLSKDRGLRWQSSQTGLPGVCGQTSALALSPAYAQDQTILAAVKGNGVFRSTDGGEHWQPAGAGLPHMGVRDLAFSPGFAADRTAFAIVPENGLQRSTDAGVSWRTLNTPSALLMALSSEFDRDGTVAIYAARDAAGMVQFSEDRGDHWRDATGPVPGEGGLRLLSLAPAFARWRVMFALDSAGDLYRSADSGGSWQPVLETGGAQAERAMIVYGPDEAQRTVFLLVTGTRYEGESRRALGDLFRSTDGGQSWSAIDFGAGLIPAALAISPSFAEDGLILLGAADGRVLNVRGLDLPAR